jgi:hypothetical protein
LEDHHASRHYLHRIGRTKQYSSYPKLTLAVDVDTHLILAALPGHGPDNDAPYFPPVLRAARQQVNIKQVLADMGYDSEAHHVLCRSLGIRRSVIPINKRGRRVWPKAKYRRQLQRRFPNRLYRRRAQIESVNSRLKRRLGSALTARTDATRDAECYIRVLTFNLMILRCRL